LAVPVLATAGGVVFLTEPVSLRLAVSALLVIGGIALTLAGRQLGARRQSAAVAR
jgi:drug/metabolite transporter (DMT)-like permease